MGMVVVVLACWVAVVVMFVLMLTFEVCGCFCFEVASFRVIGCRWRGGVNVRLDIEQALVERI